MKAGMLVIALAGLSFASCGILSGGSGACVSSPVSYNYGQRVYCYDGWDKSECDANDANRVNGASWSFHGGQTCADRGLNTGSNPWP